MDTALERLQGLYRAHGPDLLRYLGRLTRDRAQAEDLLQETFVQALRHPERLKAIRSPKAWLFKVARNVAISARRKVRPAVALPDQAAEIAKPAEDPRLERMRVAILRLPAEQREVLELRLRDELTYEEIAEVLGVPPGTVRSRIHNAVKHLRDSLTWE